MKTVTVRASRTYEVKIGTGLLSGLGAEVTALGGIRKAAVISDSTVFPLYGQRVMQSLSDAGLETADFVFPAGEASKNGATLLEVLNSLAENRLTRSDLVVALGGGVVGDLAGFAAAVYLRGIRFVQIPTTLLAAVDSSVGGKTAVDLPAGKNLAGAFWQPSLVLCDLDTLTTLPENIFRDGCAEVIKYGVLYDPALFAHLAARTLHFDREAVIARCVELKRDVVAQDEFDTGVRMKLNLGHTVGHGVEARSGFTVSHGKAVAIGMAVIARAAEKKGFCTTDTRRQIEEVLRAFGLPTRTEEPAAALADAALSDKKRTGGTVRLIVPRTVGECGIEPVPVAQLEDWIQAGL